MKAWVYRTPEFLSLEEAQEDGAAYEFEIDDDVGYDSMFFRDCLSNMDALQATLDRCVNYSATVCVIQCPDGVIRTLSEAMKHSYKTQFGEEKVT